AVKQELRRHEHGRDRVLQALARREVEAARLVVNAQEALDFAALDGPPKRTLDEPREDGLDAGATRAGVAGENGLRGGRRLGRRRIRARDLNDLGEDVAIVVAIIARLELLDERVVDEVRTNRVARGREKHARLDVRALRRAALDVHLRLLHGHDHTLHGLAVDGDDELDGRIVVAAVADELDEDQ